MTIEQSESGGVKEGQNYYIWRVPLLSVGDFQACPTDQKLKYLLHFGIMAASSHNTQPEAFSLNPTDKTISVFLNKTRVLPASDVKGRQACISIGWTIANIAIASRYYQLEPEIKLSDINPEDVRPHPENGGRRYIDIAKISLKASTASPTVDIRSLQALQTRRVNRKTYDSARPVPLPVIDKIKDIAGSGVSLHLIMRGDPRMALLAELQAQADGWVAAHELFANELAGYLVPNDTDSDFGMPGDTFNLDDQTTEKIRAGLTDISKRNAIDMGGFSRSSRKGIESAALVGMLTCKEDSPSSWINAGISLGKIANTLEQEGVSLAIHAGLAEVGFVRRGLAALSLTSEKPVILYRAGYSNKGEELPPHSPRAGINSLLIT